MELSSQVNAVVLAAGRGSRMQSTLPKVLHKVQGVPLIGHVLNALQLSGVQKSTLVISPNTSEFQDFLNENQDLNVCIQQPPLGTGHAVAATAAGFQKLETVEYAESHLYQGQASNAEYLLVCTGDTPAIRSKTLKAFLVACTSQQVDVGVLGMDTPNPFGYGRLVLESEHVLKIVEEKDASDQEKKITICNTGILFFKVTSLNKILKLLKPQNSQQEYYLTDSVKLANDLNMKVYGHITPDWEDFLGVNTQDELSRMSEYMETRVCAG